MEGPTDNLKWFGECFDGFPKRLPEGCVEYTLFILDSKLESFRDIRSRLENVRAESANLTRKLLGEYIWHQEGFCLNFHSGEGDESPPFLGGQTNYGDSVEDEWLVVYLLLELSKLFKDLWIKVSDADGEFLLIEAAAAIPRWLNPEVADNRVWIHKGKLLIIPRSQEPSKLKAQTRPISRPLSLEEALTIIKKKPESLRRFPLVEKEAFYRLQKYPGQIAESLHHAIITIPRNLAQILHEKPALISPAIDAFYLRDPISLRPLKETSASVNANKLFLPTDLVAVSTKFTKIGYAQLKSQQFNAPKEWQNILTNGPPESFNSSDIGMKVTLAFEMLMHDPQNRDKQPVREIQQLLAEMADRSQPLSNDSTIASWPQRADSENWLDIDFADFNAELSGTASSGPGFGDASTQADLRKMVDRFSNFMNDETAGPDGAEFSDDDSDEMDHDSDDEDGAENGDGDASDEEASNLDLYDEDESSVSSSGEDKSQSFNEAEFARSMREMMGLPPDAPDDASIAASLPAVSRPPRQRRRPRSQPDFSEDSGSDVEIGTEAETEAIRDMMRRMEEELNEAGALDFHPKVGAIEGRENAKGKWKGKDRELSNTLGREDSEETLVRNMLESFKSQGGTAGPAGNMMGMMGMRLPRDADQEAGGDDELDHEILKASSRITEL
ncbi:MAG: hypothetical protein M1829_000943 [Trizodia sp. TS-e1964]|nr:MAG: hypothetical protein M1829_000943 [Trizodia sp. TS-e1964]